MMKRWKSLLKTTAAFGLALSFAMPAHAQDAADPCASWEAYPGGVKEALEKHVMYRDLFKSKKYDDAFVLWSEVFKYVKSPRENKELKVPATPRRHFKDGIKMYQEKAKATTDKAEKKEHIASMMSLYDQLAKCTGEKSLDRAYEGYYIYSLRGDALQAIEMFEKAIELGKKETHQIVLTSYAQIAVYYYTKKHPKFTGDYMRALHVTLKDIADHNIANNKKSATKYQAKWTKVEAEFAKIGGTLWGCDFYVNQWKPKFEADKANQVQNAEIVEEIKRKCGKDNDFYKEVWAVYQPYKRAQDSIEAENNFDALCNLKKATFRERQSRGFAKAGDDAKATEYKNEAFDWYQKALETTEEACPMTNDEKGDLAYRIADFYFRKGNFNKARSLCRKASEFKPKWGKPYILVGLMYASSGKRCGPGTGWDSQVVTWAAVDEWSKAKRIDATCSGDVNRKIAKYSKYFPAKGDIFQRGLKEGAAYNIRCWIGVTTTIRAAK